MHSRHTLFTFSIIAAALAIASAAAGEDPQITVTNPPAAWKTQSASPIRIDVRARRAGRLDITLKSGSRPEYTVMKTVDLPANSAGHVEMTIPAAEYFIITCDGGTSRLSRSVPVNAYSERSASVNYPMPLACVNSFLLRDLELLDESKKKEDAEFRPIALDELPSRWQSYSGFVGMLVMDPREVRSLRLEQREALVRWVYWFGGSLWLAGEGAKAAAEEMGLRLGDVSNVRNQIMRYQAVNGFVYIQPKPDAAELASVHPQLDSTDPLANYYDGQYGSYYGTTPGNWLVEALGGGVSINVIIATLLVLGVVMGPINFWYIRRRKNSLLFFLTTPLIALAGTAAIFGASLLGEGFGGRYNQCSVLIRNAGGEDAMLYDGRGVRSGFFAASPRFSEESLVLPIRYHGTDSGLTLDMTDGVRLAGGWLMPRFSTGYLVARPVVSRMNVEVVKEGGGYHVVNGLGFTIHEVAARVPGGALYQAENIAPGAKAAMRRGDEGGMFRELRQQVDRLFDTRGATNMYLVARCSGLPYLDDGGLGGGLESGSYYYCVAGGYAVEDRP